MSDTDSLVTGHLVAKIHSHQVCEEEGTDSPTYQDNTVVSTPTSKSLWTYIKWLIWTAVSRLLSCGISVLGQHFDDPWPTATSLSRHREVGLYSACTNRTDESDNIVPPLGSKDCASDSHSSTLAEQPGKVGQKTEVIESLTSPRDWAVIPVDPSPKSTNNVQNVFDQKLLSDLEVAFDNENTTFELLPESTVHYSSTFTLLNAYYADSVYGRIDGATRDQLVASLLTSVIPRNLSDCSEISTPAAIRKMYAWTEPNIDCLEGIENAQPASKFDIRSTSSNSDEQWAYPGKLTMSDSSYTPLSPLTAESCTLIGDCSSSPPKHTDLGLPHIDRQDQTLAWAMANLKTDGDTLECELPMTDNSSTKQLRQSRDKSPVKTVNSLRLPDTLSMPSIRPFEGYQLFDSRSARSVEETEMPKPKRSSSLKSQRTPPGTPGQKAVRFADAFGLDLESVRHVFDLEAPPKIPASATFDLHLDTDESIARIGAKQFGLCFPQPGLASNFVRRVLNQAVSLEDARVDMPRGLLTGTIRVKSFGFEKRVHVRITYNNWMTYCDTPAAYVQGSHDGATDRFSFSVVFPDTMIPGDRAQFAIRYETHTGEQFWDNNNGQNYSVTCYAKATDLAGDGSWVHYL
ncbi:protein phosphatase 1 regulatory subunit 3A/B/C/D/E [Paragonimus westermani]|uniref:Protein phosphatase 1 regulatory subunit 3A/B/C/D/E n=1 Tax=Paragonimus westermani TaxID=34504 RepID=A0A5J4NTF7_9TREM|nr:protein phosphatase 1 regulatory subunit 3A/B/C/D/E [Paragonimus westermani]